MKKNLELLQDYAVNEFTMAVLPYKFKERSYSKIIEVDREFIVSKKPIDVINFSCKYYGNSYIGKKEGTKSLIDVTHKSPIAIEPHNMIFFFPTASPSKSHCAWISYMYVRTQKPSENAKTHVIFSNKRSIEFDISITSFEAQLYRTAHLCVALKRRMGEMHTMNFIMTRKTQEDIIFQDYVNTDSDRDKLKK